MTANKLKLYKKKTELIKKETASSQSKVPEIEDTHISIVRKFHNDSFHNKSASEKWLVKPDIIKGSNSCVILKEVKIRIKQHWAAIFSFYSRPSWSEDNREFARLPQWLLQSQWPMKISTESYPIKPKFLYKNWQNSLSETTP